MYYCLLSLADLGMYCALWQPKGLEEFGITNNPPIVARRSPKNFAYFLSSLGHLNGSHHHFVMAIAGEEALVTASLTLS